MNAKKTRLLDVDYFISLSFSNCLTLNSSFFKISPKWLENAAKQAKEQKAVITVVTPYALQNAVLSQIFKRSVCLTQRLVNTKPSK